MAKVKIPVRFIFRLLPALIAAVEEITEAAHPDSDGGAKITKAEAKQIGEAVLDRLRPVIERELDRMVARG